MAQYRVRETYPVEVVNPQTGKTEIEQRKFDPQLHVKKHQGKYLAPGHIVDLTPEQLKIHGEKFFDPIISETDPQQAPEMIIETK